MTYQMPMSSMDLYSIKSCKILTSVRLQRTPELYEEFLSHFWKQEAESGMMLSASTQIPRYSSPKMIYPMHHSMEEKIRFGSGLPDDCHTCWPCNIKKASFTTTHLLKLHCEQQYEISPPSSNPHSLQQLKCP